MITTKFVSALILAAFLPAFGAPWSSAQILSDSPAKVRQVRNNTIHSPQLPKADLTFADSYRYVGGQQVNLYGVADAEQHLFIKDGKEGVIDAFFWIQFEHLVPSDNHRYNYPADHTTNIGDLSFVYDTKSWTDYASGLVEDPASDGADISHLLARTRLTFPRRAARIRMFHLPTADHRTELMIIYGEALPEGSVVPARKEGVDLTQESPEFAAKMLENLRTQMTISTK